MNCENIAKLKNIICMDHNLQEELLEKIKNRGLKLYYFWDLVKSVEMPEDEKSGFK